MHILVADDDSDILALVAFKLTQGGFEVTTVGDGLTAFEETARLQPDLVILDVMMPGMSGLDVCRALRASPETDHIPVIILTARAREADLEAGFSVGADDYLVKPFSPRELLSRVEAVLSRARK